MIYCPSCGKKALLIDSKIARCETPECTRITFEYDAEVKTITYDSVITLLYDLKIPGLQRLNEKQKETVFRWTEQWQ